MTVDSWTDIQIQARQIRGECAYLQTILLAPEIILILVYNIEDGKKVSEQLDILFSKLTRRLGTYVVMLVSRFKSH